MGVNSTISARNLQLPPMYSWVKRDSILTVFYQLVSRCAAANPTSVDKHPTFCLLQFWNVYSIFPAELWLPASRSTLPPCQHRLQGGRQHGKGQGLPDCAEGDMEAAHQPAVRRAAHANTRLLPLPGSHSQGGGVSEDGLQLEDEGGAGQLDAQCLLCGLCTCLVCQGNKSAFFRSKL